MLEFFNSLVLHPFATGMAEISAGNLWGGLMVMILPVTIIMTISIVSVYFTHYFYLLFKQQVKTVLEVRVLDREGYHSYTVFVRVKGYKVLPSGSQIKLHGLLNGNIIAHSFSDEHGPQLTVTVETKDFLAENLIQQSQEDVRYNRVFNFPKTVNL